MFIDLCFEQDSDCIRVFERKQNKVSTHLETQAYAVKPVLTLGTLLNSLNYYTFIESTGYIVQCSATPANAPAVQETARGVAGGRLS